MEYLTFRFEYTLCLMTSVAATYVLFPDVCILPLLVLK
jgi:hypothetical protein